MDLSASARTDPNATSLLHQTTTRRGLTTESFLYYTRVPNHPFTNDYLASLSVRVMVIEVCSDPSTDLGL